MGFIYFRKTKKVGAVNVTASSGGVSASVRLPGGLRVRLSRRGLTLAVSKGGLTYRKTLRRPRVRRP
jgi:hypothetical protein